MPSIVDVLKQDPEELPGWLRADPVAFNRDNFFNSRTLYYPGSGDDGHPVSLCARSHAAHAFVYVDFGVDRQTISKRVQDPEKGFRGYSIINSPGEKLTKNTLDRGVSIKWHVDPSNLPRARERYRSLDIEPFAWFVVLQRDKEYDDAHGPERIAGLFIGADGHATYDALYCQGDGTPEPFMIVVQDHGFGGDYDRFGRNGILERIARECGQLPQWLLVGDNTGPWKDYKECGADAEVGGMHATPRRLYRRRN